MYLPLPLPHPLPRNKNVRQGSHPSPRPRGHVSTSSLPRQAKYFFFFFLHLQGLSTECTQIKAGRRLPQWDKDWYLESQIRFQTKFCIQQISATFSILIFLWMWSLNWCLESLREPLLSYLKPGSVKSIFMVLQGYNLLEKTQEMVLFHGKLCIRNTSIQ